MEQGIGRQLRGAEFHVVDRARELPFPEDLPGDLPVLRTLRVVFSDDGRPIEATVMVKAGHLYEVQYEFGPVDD